MVELTIDNFYTPKNRDDFEGVRSAIDRTGVLSALNSFLRCRPSSKEEYASVNNSEDLQRKHLKVISDNGNGFVIVDYSRLNMALSNFEHIYSELKKLDPYRIDQRFDTVISPPWRCDEILGIATDLKTLDYPEHFSLTYLSDLYSRINYELRVRRILEQYENVVANGFSDEEAFVEISKNFKNPDLKIAEKIVDALESDYAISLLGIANKLAGRSTFEVSSYTCGNVIDDFVERPGSIEKLDPELAGILYLVKSADTNLGKDLVKSCAIGPCLSKTRDGISDVVKCYQDSVVSLDDIRSKIRTILK